MHVKDTIPDRFCVRGIILRLDGWKSLHDGRNSVRRNIFIGSVYVCDITVWEFEPDTICMETRGEVLTSTRYFKSWQDVVATIGDWLGAQVVEFGLQKPPDNHSAMIEIWPTKRCKMLGDGSSVGDDYGIRLFYPSFSKNVWECDSDFVLGLEPKVLFDACRSVIPETMDVVEQSKERGHTGLWIAGLYVEWHKVLT